MRNDLMAEKERAVRLVETSTVSELKEAHRQEIQKLKKKYSQKLSQSQNELENLLSQSLSEIEQQQNQRCKLEKVKNDETIAQIKDEVNKHYIP